MSITVTANATQQVYCVQSNSSVSTLGFDTVLAYAKELVRRISQLRPTTSRIAIDEASRGSVELYAQYQQLMAQYAQLGDQTTWFDERTPAPVRQILERYRLSGRQLRVYYGSSDGRDWLNEVDTVGKVGRSMGPMKAPLLIEGRADYGSALLTHCIVRLRDAKSGEELYRRKDYHQPAMRIAESFWGEDPAYTHAVEVQDRNGEWAVHAQFTSAEAMKRWMEFIK